MAAKTSLLNAKLLAWPSMLASRPWLVFFLISVLTFLAILVALPSDLPIKTKISGQEIDTNLGLPRGVVPILGFNLSLPNWPLKKGLDIQGGLQVTLEADMTEIADGAKDEALLGVKNVIQRRVDVFGLSEAHIQSSRLGEKYRLLVELPGVTNTSQALQLIGQTAKLDFRLEKPATAAAEVKPQLGLEDFEATGLTGQHLLNAQVQFNQQTNKPEIAIQFDPEGTVLFSEITGAHKNKSLAIFIDNYPLTIPTISDQITTGQAVIGGDFTPEEAQQLAAQLSAGTLPVPLKVAEQRVIGASLGQVSINQTIAAGLVGLGLVVLFMILNYGFKGVIAVMGLALYAIYTLAVYKILGVTLTVPGIAGLLLSIGMAVDSNILIFERLKEELRWDRPFKVALERSFGRAWNSIKDANFVTMLVALILINPLNLGFLNSSGTVRGFGVTLLIGIVISLFTGVVVTRTLMILFLSEPKERTDE